MNFVVAVVIGVVVGLAAWFMVRGKQANAIWLAPLAGAIGAVIASGLATAFGTPGYGIKEIILQVVLAAAGAGAVTFGSMRKAT